MPNDISDAQWGSYILALGGFFLGHLIVGASSKAKLFKNIKSLSHIEADTEYYNASLNKSLIIILFALSFGATCYMWFTFGVPFFSENVDDARVNYLSNGYIATIASLLDIVAIFSFAYVCSCKGKKKGAFYYICIAIIFTFFVVAILAGSRSRLMKLVLPAVVIYNFMYRRISIWNIAAFAGICAFLIGGIGYYRSFSRYGSAISEGIGGQSVDWNTIQFILYYISQELRNGALGLDIVMKAIPAQSDYMYGLLHLGPFVTPLKIGIPVPGDYFKDLIGGRWSGFGLAATFLAPMYADLSLPGVFFFSTVYSVVLMRVYNAIFSETKLSSYRICEYSIYFYFFISGIRSDILSFEFIFFVLVASLIKRRARVINSITGSPSCVIS